MNTPHRQASGAAPPEAKDFYAQGLVELNRSGIPFLLGGTYAVAAYTGINRPTKDMDVFCRAGDYPRILNHFARAGYATEVEDARWIAKVRRGPLFFDVIFNSTIAINPVTESWFAEAHDGADVAHLILCTHHSVDWRRLLSGFDSALPQGLDTPAGERGFELSAGQDEWTCHANDFIG